ncbi:DUF4845 domain-containing protein [Wenzhouxiangella limi]|uniref:DUF4845 domain-containing protein n=1 Tax=Wenzhouxiangella limi TaxID=2707351 RepID=A0A845UXA0_9GAMM|nr:DUF4845 domain-containing protein [Wenzhouxiangella limi]NDY94470.1 DUF4845 domain-containing protein [Wenzhouxiangella limi]
MKQINRTRGMTLIGFLLVLALVLFAAYMGIKLVPIYLNHFSVVSEMKAVASEPGTANMPPQTVRRNLMTRMDVSYVKHVRPEDVRVVRGDGVNLVVSYEVEEHLIGNIDAIIRFHRVEPLSN